MQVIGNLKSDRALERCYFERFGSRRLPYDPVRRRVQLAVLVAVLAALDRGFFAAVFGAATGGGNQRARQGRWDNQYLLDTVGAGATEYGIRPAVSDVR